MAWTIRGDSADQYRGLIASCDGMSRDLTLVRTWLKDATAEEVACALERLAADIRAHHNRTLLDAIDA
jgi:hypothetical protein